MVELEIIKLHWYKITDIKIFIFSIYLNVLHGKRLTTSSKIISHTVYVQFYIKKKTIFVKTEQTQHVCVPKIM